MNRVRVAKLVYHYTIGVSKTFQEVYRRLVMTSAQAAVLVYHSLNPLRLPCTSPLVTDVAIAVC